MLRSFIFCSGLVPFTARHLSVLESFEDALQFALAPAGQTLPWLWQAPLLAADLMQLFSGHKELKTFESVIILLDPYFVLFY